jgi:sulfur-carrier protein
VRVALRSILSIREALGGADLTVDVPEGTTISQFLDYMCGRWGEELSRHLFDPENGLPLPCVRIMINGQTIQFLHGMGTVLKDGDDVLLLPLVGGG